MPMGIGRGRGNRSKKDSAPSPGVYPSEHENNNNEEILEISRPKVSYIPDDNAPDYKMFTNTGINFDKYQSIKVHVTGSNSPPSASTIEELDLPKFLLKNIEGFDFTKLTPVQKFTIPMMLGGRDFIACAQTGSGKTAAFLFPIIKRIYEIKNSDDSKVDEYKTSPLCIILVPTRELCRQVFTFCKMYCNNSCIEPSYCYGGVQVMFSLARIRNSDILACTPGRLVFLLSSNLISLKKIKFIVLDEADKLLKAESFNESIEQLFKTASDNGTRDYQVSMFSATFPSEIQYYAKTFLREYLFVTVGEVGEACHDIKQILIETNSEDKLKNAIEYMEKNETGKTLIFVCTKRQADFYGIRLVTMGKKATTIHGDRDQAQREIALNDFKSDRVQYLVATDVASRGLDIPKVDTVINVDMPEDIDIYVHRIGRTGRCGNVGCSVTFFDGDRDMKLAGGLVRVLEQAGQDCPDWLKMSAGDGVAAARVADNIRKRASLDSRKDVERSTYLMNGCNTNKQANNNNEVKTADNLAIAEEEEW